MAKQIDKEIINQIPILYQELKNKSKVARRLGISAATVSKYLSLCEATSIEEPKKIKRTVITAELEKEINEKYQKCRNMSQVARELNIATTTVRNHLNKESLLLIEKEKNDRDALFFYIYHLFGPVNDDLPISKHNITQMQKFRKQGMPYQGQLLTLKYFYEVEKHSKDKSNGSIGIIPYVYEKAKLYYTQQAKRAVEINEAIQRQLEQDRITIKYNPNDYFGNKKKKTIDLNTLGE